MLLQRRPSYLLKSKMLHEDATKLILKFTCRTCKFGTDGFHATARFQGLSFWCQTAFFCNSSCRTHKIIMCIYSVKMEKIWYLCLLSAVLHAWQKQPSDENCSEKMVQLSTSPAKMWNKNTWDYVVKAVERADAHYPIVREKSIPVKETIKLTQVSGAQTIFSFCICTEPSTWESWKTTLLSVFKYK